MSRCQQDTPLAVGMLVVALALRWTDAPLWAGAASGVAVLGLVVALVGADRRRRAVPVRVEGPARDQ